MFSSFFSKIFLLFEAKKLKKNFSPKLSKEEINILLKKIITNQMHIRGERVKSRIFPSSEKMIF